MAAPRFRRILAYAESADAACLEQVIEFAERQGASLSVCDVIESAPVHGDADGMLGRLKALDWQQAFDRLRRLCAPYMQRVDLDFTVLIGNAFLAVTEQVVQQGFDLVVHIQQTESGDAGVGLNPTGMHLMRKCPCAVWSLAPERRGAGRDLVLAVDRSLADEGVRTDDFSVRLAVIASAMAKMRGGRLHVVHAWQPYAARLLDDPRIGADRAHVHAYLRAQSDDHERWFRGLLGRMEDATPDGVLLEGHLEQGDSRLRVAALTREVDAGLLVLGTIGTSSIPGVLIGTTAEATLAAAPTAILAIKPQGFRSPLQFSETRLPDAGASAIHLHRG